MALRAEDDAASVRSRSRAAESERRNAFVGLDHASIMSTELLSSVLTWTAIGWLVDRWLGTAPWAIAIGAMIGNAAGLYLVFLRSGRMEGFDGADTTRRTPAAAAATPVPATTTATDAAAAAPAPVADASAASAAEPVASAAAPAPAVAAPAGPEGAVDGR